MAFVIVVVFINIQLIINESLSQGFPNQINVRNAALCVLVRIAQLVEHPVETDQLTFIKRHRAFHPRKLLFIILFCIYLEFIFILFIYLFLFFFLFSS